MHDTTPISPTPVRMGHARRLVTASSVLLGLGAGSAVAAWLEVLLLPRPTILVLLVLGLICLIGALTIPDADQARRSLRPVVFLISAAGFFALDVGIIWLIMTFAWR